MDMRVYYKKVKETEASITDAHVVVVSIETGDGGTPGVATEVARGSAARLIVEGKARLATDEERLAFHTRYEDARKAAEQNAAAAKLQLTVISESELRALRSGKGKS